jgi:hypothetical protein
MRSALPVLNLTEAKFECIFGRGCEGICCQNGRPSIDPDEAARIDANLARFLPHLRPEARAVVEAEGYVSRRKKLGHPMLRVVQGWCIFFNEGCVLHKVGAAEGDKYRYKPSLCALFPLSKNEKDEWYVRQHGVQGEVWDLFCLDPKATTVPAAQSLKEEIKLAARYEAEAQAARTGS